MLSNEIRMLSCRRMGDDCSISELYTDGSYEVNMYDRTAVRGGEVYVGDGPSLVPPVVASAALNLISFYI